MLENNNLDSQNLDMEYLKNLEVTFEESDTVEDGSYYTDWFTVKERFSDNRIKDYLAEMAGYIKSESSSLDEMYGLLIQELLLSELIGELKMIEVKDCADKILYREDFC